MQNQFKKAKQVTIQVRIFINNSDITNKKFNKIIEKIISKPNLVESLIIKGQSNQNRYHYIDYFNNICTKTASLGHIFNNLRDLKVCFNANFLLFEEDLSAFSSLKTSLKRLNHLKNVDFGMNFEWDFVSHIAYFSFANDNTSNNIITNDIKDDQISINYNHIIRKFKEIPIKSITINLAHFELESTAHFLSKMLEHPELFKQISMLNIGLISSGGSLIYKSELLNHIRMIQALSNVKNLTINTTHRTNQDIKETVYNLINDNRIKKLSVMINNKHSYQNHKKFHYRELESKILAMENIKDLSIKFIYNKNSEELYPISESHKSESHNSESHNSESHNPESHNSESNNSESNNSESYNSESYNSNIKLQKVSLEFIQNGDSFPLKTRILEFLKDCEDFKLIIPSKWFNDLKFNDCLIKSIQSMKYSLINLNLAINQGQQIDHSSYIAIIDELNGFHLLQSLTFNILDEDWGKDSEDLWLRLLKRSKCLSSLKLMLSSVNHSLAILSAELKKDKMHSICIKIPAKEEINLGDIIQIFLNCKQYKIVVKYVKEILKICFSR